MTRTDARMERNRRGFLNSAANTFGLLRSEPRESADGWRMAAVLDGEFVGWLCDQPHGSLAGAAACERAEPLTGHTLAERQDSLSGPLAAGTTSKVTRGLGP